MEDARGQVRRRIPGVVVVVAAAVAGRGREADAEGRAAVAAGRGPGVRDGSDHLGARQTARPAGEDGSIDGAEQALDAMSGCFVRSGATRAGARVGS